jgi:hypothetical protein
MSRNHNSSRRPKKMSNHSNFNEMKKRSAGMVSQQMQSIAPNLLPGVTVDALVELKCNNCQGETFYPVHTVRLASPLQSRNSMPTLVQFPLGFACATCDKINPFDNPQDGRELKAKQEKKKENPEADLSVSVEDGTKTGEKLN